MNESTIQAMIDRFGNTYAGRLREYVGAWYKINHPDYLETSNVAFEAGTDFIFELEKFIQSEINQALAQQKDDIVKEVEELKTHMETTKINVLADGKPSIKGSEAVRSVITQLLSNLITTIKSQGV